MELKRLGTKRIVHENQNNGVYYLTFPTLSQIPGVIHGFSSRIGGVSQNELSSMNLSFSRGDDPANVLENYKRISDAIGFDYSHIVCSDQTHTVNVRKVGKEDWGKGILRERGYHDVDGLITNETDVILATSYADCVPLYFVDPVKKAIGLSHSGWRGTVANIAGETVHKMQEEYGTNPADLIAAIGPSICQGCYEVSEDVIQQFQASYEKEYWDELFYQKSETKYQLNLHAACKINMKKAGILEENISVTDVCTCCNPDILFSHRASKGKRGNLSAFLGLQ